MDGPPGFFINDDIPTKDTKQLNFEVSWHGQVLLVSLDETDTVGKIIKSFFYDLLKK